MRLLALTLVDDVLAVSARNAVPVFATYVATQATVFAVFLHDVGTCANRTLLGH